MDYAELNDGLLETFGATYTFVPESGVPVEITAIRETGDAAFGEQFVAALWTTISQFATEPQKGDMVTVPASREIQAGSYRVAKAEREDEAGRRLYLQWVRP